MLLYYNCDNPLPILATGLIKCSKVFTGVSLSEWSELGSHGPFKITFKDAPWFSQCARVLYWTILPCYDWEKSPAIQTPEYFAHNQDGERVSKAEYTEKAKDYDRRIWKCDTFQTEREYYSPTEISFQPEDVVRVTFMTNSPNIHPRKFAKIRRELSMLPYYEEREVCDPYLGWSKAPLVRAPAEPKVFVIINGWSGQLKVPAVMVDETPKRYRVRILQRSRWTGRLGWVNAGDIVLVPKTAVKLQQEPAHV